MTCEQKNKLCVMTTWPTPLPDDVSYWVGVLYLPQVNTMVKNLEMEW